MLGREASRTLDTQQQFLTLERCPSEGQEHASGQLPNSIPQGQQANRGGFVGGDCVPTRSAFLLAYTYHILLLLPSLPPPPPPLTFSLGV